MVSLWEQRVRPLEFACLLFGGKCTHRWFNYIYIGVSAICKARNHSCVHYNDCLKWVSACTMTSHTLLVIPYEAAAAWVGHVVTLLGDIISIRIRFLAGFAPILWIVRHGYIVYTLDENTTNRNWRLSQTITINYNGPESTVTNYHQP